MAVIIDFNKYIEAKEYEKQCMRLNAQLIVKRNNLEGLLNNLQRDGRCTLNTRHYGENTEYLIYGDLLDVIIDSIKSHIADIERKIDQLEILNVT